MSDYRINQVIAPAWMKEFQCLAGACPNTCCQAWDIEVDARHAGAYQTLDDPELHSRMGFLLQHIHLRQAHAHEAKDVFRLNLLKQPGKRCALLDKDGNCALQVKYGAGILCDTCYFFPRLFWQVGEQFCMSASLSCPQAARLALCDPQPVRFCSFPAETDPEYEWLEPALIGDQACRELLGHRADVIHQMIAILQNRSLKIPARVQAAADFLTKLSDLARPWEPEALDHLRQSCSQTVEENAHRDEISPEEQIRLFLEAFSWSAREQARPLDASAQLILQLLSGRQKISRVISAHYAEALTESYLPFVRANPHLEENFLVHFVFSESFKQFDTYQNAAISASDVLHFEAELLRRSFILFRVLQCKNCLIYGKINEPLFLRTVCEMDKDYLHYSGWLAASIHRLDG